MVSVLYTNTQVMVLDVIQNMYDLNAEYHCDARSLEDVNTEKCWNPDTTVNWSDCLVHPTASKTHKFLNDSRINMCVVP